METPKRNPAIGFVGILVILAGIGLFCCSNNNTFFTVLAALITLAGLGILVYALATGNIKLFG